MDDSDPTNIDRVGHRCWCLSPPMAATGFGHVKGFTAMWAFDKSRKPEPDIAFISVPPAGYMPAPWMGTHWAWSVGLSSKHFEAPQDAAIAIDVVVPAVAGAARVQQVLAERSRGREVRRLGAVHDDALDEAFRPCVQSRHVGQRLVADGQFGRCGVDRHGGHGSAASGRRRADPLQCRPNSVWTSGRPRQGRASRRPDGGCAAKVAPRRAHFSSARRAREPLRRRPSATAPCFACARWS